MAPGLVMVLIIFMIRSCLVSAVFAEDCPRYFNCEGIGELYFPFTNSMNPECGLYVRGCGEKGAAVEVRLGNENKNQTWFEIERISGSTGPQITLLVKDRTLEDLRNSPLNFLDKGNCSIEGYNITLPPSTPLMSFKKEFEHTLTLFFCNKSIHVTPSLFHNGNYYITDCVDDNHDYLLYYGVLMDDDVLPVAFNGCTITQLPAISTNVSYLESSYAAEFYLKVVLSEDCRKCFYEREGHCRVNDTGDFSCVFEAPVAVAEQGHGLGNVLTVTLAASTAMVTILVVLRCCFRRKVTPASIFFWKGENPIHQKIDIFLKNHEFLQTKRYTYSEIREMTNSFKNKLGQGGYGSVYKGKLPDGRLVAVKVLNKLKGNGEEFINEVATISQTSHVNVVSLFGFCFQGSKRALVYEFMPNGSLEKFIYEDNAAMVDRQLDCKTLHDIAIGTARGLEYLHRGCNTRILHFDIKPHNILLDVDFCPKISDFGLAKICPRKESIVSMLGARGTAGYIAPEVFSRNFGGVSHKSDVYSFGMMVLEMVGGRKNINVEVECSSEIYFPHWIYKCLEQNQQLALRCIKNENDNEMVRKMILVSLWCIQTDPSARPAMSKVVEMLEGSLESLQIPPKPFLSSPKSSPVHCSISTCETVSVIT